MAGVMIFAESNGGAPTVNDCPASSAECPIRAVAASRSARHLWATRKKSLPYAVGATCRVVRSNNRNPSCVSSSRIVTLRPEGVMNNASAAREKLRCRATKRKARSCLEVKSICEFYSTTNELFELVSQQLQDLNGGVFYGSEQCQTCSKR